MKKFALSKSPPFGGFRGLLEGSSTEPGGGIKEPKFHLKEPKFMLRNRKVT
jgi:hypothetical protein